jgi:hypothetical protein
MTQQLNPKSKIEAYLCELVNRLYDIKPLLPDMSPAQRCELDASLTSVAQSLQKLVDIVRQTEINDGHHKH